MKKIYLYECNKCFTLLHNNSCACGNAASISSKDYKMLYLFVDDINTVNIVACYIDMSKQVKRIEYVDEVVVSSVEYVEDTSEYIKYAKRMFKEGMV